jgi:hypothetical protein
VKLIEPLCALGEVLIRNLVHDLRQHAHHLDVVHGSRPGRVGLKEQEVPPVLAIVGLPVAMGVVACAIFIPPMWNQISRARAALSAWAASTNTTATRDRQRKTNVQAPT